MFTVTKDAFLPHVEDGTIILVGATTENPSFHVNNALLSRCQVIVLEKLSAFHIRKILERALSSLNVGIRNDQNEELGRWEQKSFELKNYLFA